MEDSMLNDIEEKERVIIFTTRYQIKGEIFLYKGARLTDYMVESKPFVAVSDAEILDHQNNRLFTTSFLNVNRDHIEIIMPAEPANT